MKDHILIYADSLKKHPEHFSCITMLPFWMLWQNILCIEASVFPFRNDLLKLRADIDISPSPILRALSGIDSFIKRLRYSNRALRVLSLVGHIGSKPFLIKSRHFKILHDLRLQFAKPLIISFLQGYY